MKHSFNRAMSTVGYLIFRCEKLNSVDQSFNIRYQNIWQTWSLHLFNNKTSLFRFFCSCIISYLPSLYNSSFLLSLIWSPPGLRWQNNKVRRFAFELKMQDKSTYLLASDSEGEMEDWINTLNKILHSSFEIAMQEKRNGDIHDGAYFISAWRNTNMKRNTFCVSQNIIQPMMRSDLGFSQSL